MTNRNTLAFSVLAAAAAMLAGCGTGLIIAGPVGAAVGATVGAVVNEADESK